MRRLVILGLLWAAAVTACNEGQETLAATTGEGTQRVEQTRWPENVEVVEAVPSPTERSFQRFTIQDAIDAFRAAGLEVQNPVTLEADGHSPLPPTFVEAQRFQMPALNGRTGRIFSFKSESDLLAVQEYYEGFTGAQANLVIVGDNLLLQISADAPSDLVDAFRGALESLK